MWHAPMVPGYQAASDGRGGVRGKGLHSCFTCAWGPGNLCRFGLRAMVMLRCYLGASGVCGDIGTGIAVVVGLAGWARRLGCWAEESWSF